MPQVKRRELESLMSQVRTKASADWIQQLRALDISGAKIAHFGCAGGVETLALAWVLDACEAQGIDRDISRALGMLADLRKWLSDSLLALPYASPRDRSWWEIEVPGFLKEERFPVFICEPDIAHPTEPFKLPCDYFDLACCSNLLYQILGEQGESGVSSAVAEMKRVVAPGGWVVADEPDNGTPARFRAILEQVKLEEHKIETYTIGPGNWGTTYFYRTIKE